MASTDPTSDGYQLTEAFLSDGDEAVGNRSRWTVTEEDDAKAMYSAPRFDFCDLCTGLTDQIPAKTFNLDKGFVNERVLPTCLDADDVQIALGSNVGHIFIFNRRLRKMFTVKGKDRIECLKLSHNGGYSLLGVGLQTGLFVALRLPSSDEGKSRKVREKAIKDVHRSKITCIEWSADGRKLFTGDASGLIVMTMVDFENNVYDSSFVYCDVNHCSVAQLAYWGNFLAASTISQAFLVDIADDCRVRLIGHHSKKNALVQCGVAFVRDDGQPSDIRPRLYVSRPGCRLWRVNLPESFAVVEEEMEGVLEVMETQDYLQSTETSASLPIPLGVQRDGQPSTKSTLSAAGFGLLYCMAENGKKREDQFLNLLVTHDDYHLFVVDARQRQLVGWAQFRLHITNVAVCPITKEIFVLFAATDSPTLILRISSTFSDPWFVTPATEEKIRERRSNSEATGISGATSVKGFLQKLKNNSTEFVRQSADALSAKDFDNSAPNFQIFLNKLRASSMETSNGGIGVTMEDFEEMTNINAIGMPNSRPSTPDTMSLASGGGAALPPWCLEDQSLNEMSSVSVSKSVRVTRSKGRNGSRPPKKNNDTKLSGDSTSKSSSSDEAPVVDKQQMTLLTDDRKETTFMADDRLTTPTEEKYLLNRFNPFDDMPAPKSPAFTREQLEEMLDSTFLRQVSSHEDILNQSEIESIVECVVRDRNASMTSVDESSLHSVDSSELKKRTSSGSHDIKPQTIATSFRQLLLNEARVAVGEEPEPQVTPQRRLATARSLVSPDDGSISFIDSLGGVSGRDIWCQVSHDRPIVYIAGCAHYFAFVDVDQACRYFSYARNHAVNGDLLSTSDGKEEAWSTLPEKADAFAVSPNARIVWRVLDEVAYGRLRPGLHSPLGGRWCEAGKEVSTKIALSNSSAWYLKTDGTVCAQTQLRPDRPCYKIVHIDCEWPLVQLACTDDVVWGLRHDGRLVVRIGIKPTESTTGIDWIDFVPDGPSEVVALDLYDETAWVIDTEGRLWFCRGVNSRHPIGTTGRWWQVALPAALSSNGSKASAKRRTLPHAVCVTPLGVHIAVDRSVWYCRGGVTGHRWSHVVPAEWENVSQFRRLWASCLFDEITDYVWLIRLNNEFMAFQPHSKRLHSLVAPCLDSEVVAICGALGYVWTLDAQGRIFIRSGIDPVQCPLGSRWQMLDMTQFEGGAEKSSKFTHISCSLDAVWACDEAGRVYVRLGAAPLESTGLPSAWVRVDESDDYGEQESRGRRKSGTKKRHMVVRKLYCTPDGAAVWALTRGGRIYVRLGITHEVPIGKKWTEIEDMKARTLAVTCDCAWALSEDFELYQRYGISHENPSGNFWKPLSYKLRSVTVTPNGKLWGLDMEQRLVVHQIKLYASGSKGSDDTGVSSAESGNEYPAELNEYEVV